MATVAIRKSIASSRTRNMILIQTTPIRMITAPATTGDSFLLFIMLQPEEYNIIAQEIKKRKILS